MSTDVQTQVGRVVWHELMSTDVEAAKRFYTELLGWELETWQPGEMDYVMIKVNGQMHGGFHQLEADQGAPSHWMAHVFVDDVDGAASRAEKAGGRILFGPVDVPEVGRFVVIADPAGAVISAYKPEGDGPVSEGAFLWDELMVRDVEGAKRFYAEVFGWTTADMDMGQMGTYTLFKRAGGEADAGGLMKLPDEVQAPPHWLTYLATGDVDATIEKARGLGAAVLVDGMDIPNVGRFAVLADPTGAAFGLFKPSA